MVVVGEARVELIAELQPDQARRRGVDRQLGEELQEVDLAGVAPVGDHPLDLVLDRRGVALHLLTAQRRVVQHLRPALRIGVEHHTLAEDRRHERVGLSLVEIAVAGAEEELVGFGAGEHHDLLAGELEPADVPALLAKTLHQPDRIGAELFQVPVLFVFPTGDAGNYCSGHESCAPSSSLSF